MTQNCQNHLAMNGGFEEVHKKKILRSEQTTTIASTTTTLELSIYFISTTRALCLQRASHERSVNDNIFLLIIILSFTELLFISMKKFSKEQREKKYFYHNNKTWTIFLYCKLLSLPVVLI